jgi:hypothetical protein
MNRIKAHINRFNLIGKSLPGRFLVLCLAISIWSSTQAQQTLLDRNLIQGYKKEVWGQNLKYYGHAYGTLGFMVGSPGAPGGKVVYGLTMNPQLGGLLKFRLSRHLSFGADLSYNLYNFKIDQVPNKILPDSVLHNAESFLFGNLSFGIFFRFNFGKVGNFIGKFADVGFYGEWVSFTDHYYKDKLDNGYTFRTHVSGLDYVEWLQYGGFVRFGYTRYAIVIKHRLSDYFVKSAGYPELPRFTIGFQAGLHKVN